MRITESELCDSFLGSESLLGGNHGFDTIIHVLDKVLLRSTESSLVGDIENAIVGLGVLTVDSSDLHVVLIGDLVELSFVCFASEQWQFDMNRCSQGSSQVGWARGDVTKMLIMGELSFLLDQACSSRQPGENSKDVGTLLHGNDPKLILFVDPDKESLFFVMEDTSTCWPVPVESA